MNEFEFDKFADEYRSLHAANIRASDEAIRLFTDVAIPGWASTVVPIYFLSGLQLLGIGVVGEYLSKIYAEVKRRPRYIIEKII